MQRRRALVVGLAALTTACAGPASLATPTSSPATSRLAPVTPTSPPAPTSTPGRAPTQAPTATPQVPATPVPPTAVVTPQASAGDANISERTVDVRLWNGSAEVQLDGRTIAPGRVLVSAGPHQVAALVDGEVVGSADAPAEAGAVDLVVPPPQAALAVMIENQADARPQSGLLNADVVYEALAEGGITRFIGVFVAGDAPVVGPVRSLRHYFALLAADYAADVVHIGASPEGFAWRDALHMGYLDESAGDPGVWRVRTRPPPHNAYTDTAADRAFLAQRGRQATRGWGPLRFSLDAPRGTLAADSVTLGFLPWAYSVSYAWNPDTGRYLRFMEGLEHRDAATGEQIAPATVVVQFADVEAIPDDPKLRLDVNLVGGSGELVVFSNGTRRDGTWSKDAPQASTTWLDADATPLVIPPGPVWVEVVPLGSPLSVSQAT